MKQLLLLGTAMVLSAQLWAQSFVQQVGQITDTNLQARRDIDFKVQQSGGLQVFIGQGALHYQWIQAERVNDSTTQYDAYRMDMQLLGANTNAAIQVGEPLPGYQRYFLSWVNTENQDAGVIAKQYTSILYKDVYPHIDWQLYFTDDGALEYDFIVHPGADITQIQWQYSGHQTIELTADGDIAIRTPKGAIIQKAPISFEQASRLSIPSNYWIKTDVVGFQTGQYEGILVIDPVIKWGTYFGGVADDHCHDIAVDTAGNVYMIGTANSVSNIATQGAHQQTFSGGSNYLGADGYINKFDSDGQLVWATYYGGTNVDMLSAIAIDTAGDLYIAGYTNSATGIASDSAFQTSKMGTATRYDALLLKLDSSGTRIWATYFGGTMNDGDNGVSLTIDNNQNIWIAGRTLSNDLFLTSNAHRQTRQFSDGFITKFSPQGIPIFSSLMGGNGEETIKDIVVDTDNNIYIIGESLLSTDMATTNAYQITLGGNTDAFIARLDSVATPIWCTYIGGIYNESANAIALTDSNVIAGISSNSPNLQFGNYIQLGNNDYDGLIVDIQKDGNMKMITYLGGVGYEYVNSIKVVNNTINILMTTDVNTFNIDSNAIQPNLGGIYDIIWLQYGYNWQQLYGTYIGGSNTESDGKLKYANNHYYISGSSISNNNIGTTGTYQPLNGGANDAFIIKIADCDAITWATPNIIGADSICPHQATLFQVNAQDSVVYHWTLPTTWQGSSDSNQILVTPATQGGTIALWLSNACDLVSDTLFKTAGVFPPQTPLIQKQGNVLVCPQSFVAYQWLYEQDTIVGATQNTYLPTQNGWYHLQVIDNKSCMHRSDSFLVDYLSIDPISNNLIHIYPNPANEVLYIQSAYAGNIVVYNVLGQEVYSMPMTIGTQTIPIAKWASGVYSVVVQTSHGHTTYRIIKE